jgi:hypothetical protein
MPVYMSENVTSEELKAVEDLVRPAFRVGFQRRRRHTGTGVASERERPVLAGMEITVTTMTRDELNRLPNFEFYR